MITESEGATAASPNAAILSMVRHVASLRGEPGALAELRRMAPSEPTAPIFWKLLSKLPEHLRRSEVQETRWAMILKGMALMAPLHHSEIPLGGALRKIGYSEQRLLTLLSSRGEALFRIVPLMCRMLASHGQSTDWRQIGGLLLSEGLDEKRANAIRRQIARAYFTPEHSSTDAEPAAAA